MRSMIVVAVLMMFSEIALSSVSFSVEPQDPVGLSGYVTNDLMMETTTDWLSAILIVIPDQTGQIYQHPSGGDGPPDSSDIVANPLLMWDTFVSGGEAADHEVDFLPSIASGGLPDYDGDPRQCDADKVALTYYTTDTDDIGELLMARITLDENATGSWLFMAWTVEGGPEVPSVDITGDFTFGDEFDTDNPSYYLTGFINQGVIPEPATLCLMSLGAAFVLKRKR